MKKSLRPARSRRAMIARRLTLKAAYYSGALHAYRGVRRPKIHGLTVLMYHSIGGSDLLGPGLAVSVKNFAGQLEYLARSFDIVSLDSAVAMLRGGAAMPDNTIALTFDDGFRDNYEAAFPLLKKYGAPAAMFVATEPLTRGISLWPYRLRFLFKKTQARELRLNWPETTVGRAAFSLASGRKRRRAFEAIEPILIAASPSERERMLAEIARGLDVDAASDPADEAPTLTDEQLKKLSAGGIEIGSHTVTHPSLAGLSRADAVEELTASKKRIEAALGRRVRFLAYPFGASQHFNPDVEELTEKAGYEAALTTVPGVNGRGSDLFALKRLGVYDDPPAIFAFKLSRWFA
ncbi:MAG TPA: polysaccharide deacetylase family protein [Candidatus Binatia bacterium]|jgi:peptidoglycan/xylan/chitin deacetylase (PgdA/CDA1 family)